MLKRVMAWGIILSILATSAIAFTPTTQVQAQDDDPITVEIEGTITSIDPFMVDGFLVAPAGAFRPSDFEVGDYVEITGQFLNDDTFQAVDITLVDDTGDDDDDVGDDDDDVGDDDDDVGDDDDDVGDDDDDVGDDDDDVGDDDDDDDDDDNGCLRNDHPVLLTYADSFDVSYDELLDAHCNGGYGLGEIARALNLAAQDGVDASWLDILAMRDTMGWGDILKEFDVDPSALAPGQIISKNNKNKNQGDDTDGDDSAPGNSGNAPGQNKDDDSAPGNSGSAPGQTKDKTNNGNNQDKDKGKNK
ncbi:MAG: hypothetical protein JXA10_17930 [Anaerolineae bacterium]|nr:hypothetical protein [Anaerolineae bacterium]